MQGVCGYGEVPGVHALATCQHGSSYTASIVFWRAASPTALVVVPRLGNTLPGTWPLSSRMQVFVAGATGRTGARVVR